jgi:hypothetical protein
MKIFSRLFSKPSPAPVTPDERAASLDAAPAERIVGTALGNGEEGLRIAAIGRLSDGEALRKLAGMSADGGSTPAPSAALELAARKRLATLIDEGSIDFAHFRAAAGGGAALLSVAALCKNPSCLPAAVATIDDPQQLARLAVDGASSRLRQLAAQAIEDPGQLRELLKQVRHRDKSVYKIVKQKCDALNAADRKTAEWAAEVSAVIASLERHSERVHESFYSSILEQLVARWQAISPRPQTSQERRAEQAIERCREVVAGQQREAARRAAQQAAERAAEESRQRALEAARDAAKADADADARMRSEAAAAREAEEAARAAQRAAEDQSMRRIGGLIRQARGALADGNTQRAAGLRRSIDEKLAAAPALPGHLARQLAQLDEKLSELKQWKEHAVAPKRIELIEEMESLIGAGETPQVLADRIKALQQDWRTISKGIVSEAPEDWERFHRAAEAAYQPCREYFAAQARLRQENLEKRKNLLERLTAFETAQNWESPDWRMLARVVREAPLEWRRYFPVERQANRGVQSDFEERLGGLRARLDAWYEHNAAEKQSLIKRARHLLSMADAREAIDAMKRLQGLWKEAGPVPHDQDQSLWGEFREVCDAVYQKRQQAFAEYSAALEAAKVKALALCEQAEGIAALPGAELHAAGAALPDLLATFESLEELPRADSRALHDRFKRAMKLCEERIAQQHVRDAEQCYANLFEAARQLSAYHWAAVRNADPAERDALKQAAEAFIASVQRWPKGGHQALKEILARAPSGADAQGQASAADLRMLCIRAEINSDTPTPPEDEALRREFQVRRLMQGMGQGGRSDDADWEALALDWIRAGAVAPDLYETLQARFMRAWAKRPAQPAQWATRRAPAHANHGLESRGQTSR